MPGRHRKPSPWRGRWAGAASAGVIGLVLTVPTTAVFGSGDSFEDVDAALAAFAEVRTAERIAQLPDRSPTRASRSDARILSEEMLNARLAAATQDLAPDVQPAVSPRLRPRWATADLNLWAKPGERGRLLTVIDARAKLQSTGETRGRWTLVQVGKKSGWVRTQYLAKKKPAAADGSRILAAGSLGASGGGGMVSAKVAGTPCPDGSAIEAGLQSNTIKVYRAVCAAFPSISSWGGRGGSGDHGAGLALDIMISGPLGWDIANYLRANAGSLGVSEILYEQRIWTVLRGSEGWRPVADRGSSTANHYDHVHVSVYS